MNAELLRRGVDSLKHQYLDVSTRRNVKSFHQQILYNRDRRARSEERQKLQFNLGSGKTYSDPIQAADALLEREYGLTFLYDDLATQSIFIPPVFVSNLYKEDVSVLDFEIIEDIQRTYDNLLKHQPDYWFTKQLGEFLDHHTGNFRKNDFDNWIVRVKGIYLIREMGPPLNDSVPCASDCENDFSQFVNLCVSYLEKCDQSHHFTLEFKANSVLREKQFRNWLQRTLDKITEMNPIFKWLFALKITAVAGEMPEHWLFEKLQDAFEMENGAGKFVILYSSDILLEEDEKHSKEQEFDFILFSAERKLIVAIEVKKTLYDMKPFQQLRTYREIFEERLGDQLDEEWTFYPVLFAFEPPTEHRQSNNHFIHSQSDISSWIKDVSQQFERRDPLLPSMTQLKNVLKIIVFTLQMSKSSLQHADVEIKEKAPVGAVVHSKWTNYIPKAIEAVSTADNIVFYSNNQLPIFMSNDSRYERVILNGTYGSGKTFLLREKAEILAQQGEKVLFIFGSSHEEKTLLRLWLEDRWSLPKYKGNIRVVHKKEIGISKNGFLQPTRVGELLKDGDEHIFIDEWEPGLWDKLMRQEIAKIELSENQYLWIAFHRTVTINLNKPAMKQRQISELGSNFQILELPYSMRNSKSIIEYAHNYSTTSNDIPIPKAPINFPSGCKPSVNELVEDNLRLLLRNANENDTVFIAYLSFQRCSTEEVKSSIESLYASLRKLEPAIKVGVYFCGKDLKSLNLDAGINIVQADKCLSYIKEKKRVLILDEEALEGFEWKTINVIVPSDANSMKANLYMRCTTNLIVTETPLQKRRNDLFVTNYKFSLLADLGMYSK